MKFPMIIGCLGLLILSVDFPIIIGYLIGMKSIKIKHDKEKQE